MASGGGATPPSFASSTGAAPPVSGLYGRGDRPRRAVVRLFSSKSDERLPSRVQLRFKAPGDDELTSRLAVARRSGDDDERYLHSKGKRLSLGIPGRTLSRSPPDGSLGPRLVRSSRTRAGLMAASVPARFVTAVDAVGAPCIAPSLVPARSVDFAAGSRSGAPRSSVHRAGARNVGYGRDRRQCRRRNAGPNLTTLRSGRDHVTSERDSSPQITFRSRRSAIVVRS